MFEHLLKSQNSDSMKSRSALMSKIMWYGEQRIKLISFAEGFGAGRVRISCFMSVRIYERNCFVREDFFKSFLFQFTDTIGRKQLSAIEMIPKIKTVSRSKRDQTQRV